MSNTPTAPAGPAALRVLTPPTQDERTLARLRPVALLTGLTLGAVAVVHVAGPPAAPGPIRTRPR